ncbi:hypothetical protein BCR44DRAFT_1216676 [Catenaria anguillulae PL171]|uniref:Uncharacterized protein n=1 Tax=Catenaria anguillulae PL171 TaxID=765915 RepID=A0A1Y2I376_9FUNG|nr:hypothetical protein BCR44DRAFT_1216676 [Catenaria anguillulae PL171]
MYPWDANMVARMIAWVTDNVVLKPPAPPPSAAASAAGEGPPAPAHPPPDMHQLLVQCVDAIVLATGTPALRPVLTDHTLRAIASRYRNRQLVVRIVDVLVAQVVAAGARATAAASNAGARASGYQGGGRDNISPGADALLLTGRRRGGAARSGAGAVATSTGGHRHHHSVSGSVVGTDGRSRATSGGFRRSSDVGSGSAAYAPVSSLAIGGVGSTSGALLASSATATATATSVVASMATSASPSSSAAAIRHRRSRSTGGASNIGSSRLSPATAQAARRAHRVPSRQPSAGANRWRRN